MSEPNDRELIRYIAQTVEDMRDRMVTKDDLTRFATKDDLTHFATKDDLTHFATKDDLTRFATKDDLTRFATKDDLKRFATKDDLDAGIAAVRGDIERVAAHLDTLDHSVTLRFTAVDATVSRLRSVLYLLVKDQPDLVRFLGPEPT